jgi:hypothetical protein
VETRPGTTFRISQPNNTRIWRMMSPVEPPAFRPSLIACWRMDWYSGFCAALRIRLGLVVASSGA